MGTALSAGTRALSQVLIVYFIAVALAVPMNWKLLAARFGPPEPRTGLRAIH